MKKHGKLIALSALLIGAVATAGMTGCHFRHKSPEQKAEWVTKKIANELDLTDAQKAKLAAVKDEALKVHEQFRKERSAALDELIAQIQSERLDTAKMQELLKKRHSMVDEAAPRILPKVAEFHASLTAQQKAKAVEKIQKFRSHFDDSQ